MQPIKQTFTYLKRITKWPRRTGLIVLSTVIITAIAIPVYRALTQVGPPPPVVVDNTKCQNEAFLYQTEGDQNLSTLKRISFSGTNFNLTRLGDGPSVVNGMGYNLTDGYFYGIVPGDEFYRPSNPTDFPEHGTIQKINREGVPVATLGRPSALPRIGGPYKGYISGDIRNLVLPDVPDGGNGFGRADGRYYTIEADKSDPDGSQHHLYAIDVRPSGGLATRVIPITGGPNSVDVLTQDFAFNPKNGLLYGVKRVPPRESGSVIIYSINPATGEYIVRTPNLVGVYPLGPGPKWRSNVHGAVWFDAEGYMFAYNNTLSYVIRTPILNNGAVDLNGMTAYSASLSTQANDASACPFLSFTKTPDRATVNQGGTIRYTYRINNVMNQPLTADFEDFLNRHGNASGREFVAGSLAGNYGGGAPNDYGVSQLYRLNIENITVPAFSTISFSVDVRIAGVSLLPGNTIQENQATLSGFEVDVGDFGTVDSDWNGRLTDGTPVVDRPGSADPTEITVIPAAVPVSRKPILKVTGNDVQAGAIITTDVSKTKNFAACTPVSPTPDGDIETVIPPTPSSGSTGQYAVSASGRITGFQGDNKSGGSNDLTFNNKNLPLGGYSVICRQDLAQSIAPNSTDTVNTTITKPAPTTAKQIIKYDNGNSNQNYTLSNNPVNGFATIPAGAGRQRLTIIVDGNVQINNNISYDTNYGNRSGIPSFALIATGNIYVAEGVTRLDGLYVSNKTFSTCSNNNNLRLPVLTKDTCKNQLTINGALVANEVYFRRTNGNVGDPTPAEKLSFLPELYLSPPPSTSTLVDLTRTGFLDLPPVF